MDQALLLWKSITVNIKFSSAMKMKRLLAILILWLPFSLAAVVAIPVLLWALATDRESVWRPVGRAMDRLLATLLGFSGNYTLSAELGDSVRYQWLRKFLDWIKPDHCHQSAVNEGLKG